MKMISLKKKKLMNMIIHITRTFAKNIFLIPVGHAMRVVVKMDSVKKKKKKKLRSKNTHSLANNIQRQQ